MVLKKLIRNPISLIGLIILLGFILVAILAPVIAPLPEDVLARNPNADPYRIPRYGFASTPTPPSKEHPMGLTEGQLDIFYGIVWGTRTAFKVGLTVISISCLIGIIIGSVSAYIGGKFDEIVMRFVDIFMSFPFLIAAIVITTILGRGLENVMLAMILFRWTGYARLIRGNVLQVKQDEYVMAARAAGVSHIVILIRHILPNTIFPVIIQASMNMGSIVVTAASLSFLGLGAPEGYADWGQMISYARNWILGAPGNPLAYWYTVVYPGLAIILFVLSWNLIGDAFRDIMDPKLQG
ncbi:MAG: ABC transporter permease [Firmicutes bacterium]|nr:ABC transporter permease [Bacillota bacterium]